MAFGFRRQLHKANVGALAASVVVFAIGVMGVLGWITNNNVLRGLFPDFGIIAFSSSLCYLLLGIALILTVAERFRTNGRRIAQILTILVMTICVYTIAEYLVERWFGLSVPDLTTQLAFTANALQSRMAEATAFSLLLLAFSLWLLVTESRHILLSQGLALAVAGIAMLVVAGYLYGVTELHQVFLYTSIALHSAIALLVCSFAILYARPNAGVMAAVNAETFGGRIARRLLPAALVVPLALGWVRLRGEQLGYYGTEFGLALFALANILVFASLVWWNANSLNNAEAQQQQANVRIRKLNRLLAVLSDVNQTIVRIRDAQTLYERTCQIAVETGNLRMAWLALIDRADGKVRVAASAGVVGDFLEKLLIQLNNGSAIAGPLGERLAQGLHAVSNDLVDDSNVLLWSEDALRLGYGAWAAFPLIVAGEMRGVLSLYAAETHYFDREELKLLDELSHDLSFAIEVAEKEIQRQQAEASIKRYAQRMEILNRIDTAIIDGLSMKELVAFALVEIGKLVDCQRLGIGFHDEATGDWIAFAVNVDASDTDVSTSVKREDGLAEVVDFRLPYNPTWLETFANGPLQIIADLHALPAPNPMQRQMIKEGMRSALYVMLSAQGTLIGVFTLFSTHPDGFALEDQAVAHEISNQLAIAIQKLNLSRELDLHREQMEKLVARRTLELHQAKGRVEAILDNTTDGIVWTNPNLEISHANIAFGALFRCPPGACTGKPLTALVHPTEEARLEALMQAVKDDHQGRRAEFRGQRADGSLFSAQIGVGAIESHGDDGVSLVCTIQDISELKERERLLRFHASLQDAVSDAVIATDMERRIQSWNGAAERIYGWTAEEAVGRHAAELLQSRSLAGENSQTLAAALLQNGSLRQEITQLRKDGSRLHVLGTANVFADEHGNRLGIVSVNRDITERKVAEDALRASEERFRRLIDAAPIATVITDAEGRITLFNIQAEIIFGYTREEIVGQKVEVLVPSASRMAHVSYRAAYVDAPRVREMGSGLELFAVRQDGSEFPVEIQLSYIETDVGVQAMAFVADVTERKARERQLRYHASLQENVTEAVITTDVDFAIQSWNRAAERIYGWSAAEVIDKAIPQVLETQFEDNETLERVMQDFQEKGFWTNEVVQRHKDGHDIHILSSVMIIQNDYGQRMGVIAVNHDITERKLAERALQASLQQEREFQNYLRHLHEITIELTQIDDLVIFYQRAVEFGLTRLGFERFGLLLKDAESGMALGTFGTDAEGKLADEHGLHFDPKDLTGILMRSMQQATRFEFDADVPLYDNYRPLGTGWNAAAVLWNGTQSFGWLTADNAVFQRPASKAQLDILALYALTLGTLLGRKQVEQELRQSEANLSAMLNSTSVAIALIDLDGVIRLANQLAHIFSWRLYGRGIEVGQTRLFELELPVSDEAVHAFERVLQGEQVSGEFSKHHEGQLFVVDVRYDPVVTSKGEIIGAALSLIDISERKRVEEELREQRNFLHLVINNVPDLILVKGATGEFQLVNNLSAQIYGTTPAQMIGKRDADMNENMEEVTFFLQKDAETLATGKPVFIPEERLRDRFYQTSKIPLLNTVGEYDRLLVVASDITERKEAEEALRVAFDKERELGELKSRFVSMASHEFRTPLASILATAETLSAYRDKLSDEQIERRLGNIRGQVEHLKEIMEDVLHLSRVQAGRIDYRLEALDLDSLCRMVIEELQSQYHRPLDVIYRCESALPPLSLDVKLMRQIITNLISNAMKYSNAGTPIHIDLGVQEQGATPKIVLRVADQGIGIPESDLKHLFEPFHRAANVGTISGTGLGLAIAKESVEFHGGTITMESTVGVGSTFTVTIPVHPATFLG